MKKFKKLLKFYQNARKFERKLTDFVRLNCKNGREPHIRLPQTQESHIKPVGALQEAPEISVDAALYYLIVGATIGRPRSYRSPLHPI